VVAYYCYCHVSERAAVDYRLLVWRFDSDAKEFVMAEYDAPDRPLTEDIEEELVVRAVLRLRVMQLSQRPPWALQRPRQPRS
jgi:hypothetical protein